MQISSSAHAKDLGNDLKAMRQYKTSPVSDQCDVLVIASPGPDRVLSNSYAYGQADADACCNGILNVINWSSGHCYLPASGEVDIYLDIEAGWSGYASYWQGWWNNIYYFTDPSTNTQPFFPCAYCDPNDGHACSELKQNSNTLPYTIWSSEPDYSCDSSSYKCVLDQSMPWGGQSNCSGVYTALWQYNVAGDPCTSSCAEETGGCCTYQCACSCNSCYDNAFPPVDLDTSTSDANQLQYMLVDSDITG